MQKITTLVPVLLALFGCAQTQQVLETAESYRKSAQDACDVALQTLQDTQAAARIVCAYVDAAPLSAETTPPKESCAERERLDVAVRQVTRACLFTGHELEQPTQ